MTDQANNSHYTEEELQANSQVDAVAIFAAVIVMVSLVIFFVAS
ncbi:hypothetical protein QGM61_05140 [Pseudohongiella sp. SYSU M77423]|nr:MULTISPECIES: hypothetical protein [unclassified Pseudohongiella]MDH7943195.1 hypothetical protein [Pseudohongiella sp. SYSU M77423]MEC8860077.1 hypothetical protein [Pseudomonadota bacterium]|tara:strand:- start:639 stop:770 length:132 start_codon:yes stop_codon:yes gene_type:complete